MFCSDPGRQQAGKLDFSQIPSKKVHRDANASSMHHLCAAYTPMLQMGKSAPDCVARCF